jgi:hypothetical protein
MFKPRAVRDEPGDCHRDEPQETEMKVRKDILDDDMTHKHSVPSCFIRRKMRLRTNICITEVMLFD